MNTGKSKVESEKWKVGSKRQNLLFTFDFSLSTYTEAPLRGFFFAWPAEAWRAKAARDAS
jgi:hypothetical protein